MPTDSAPNATVTIYRRDYQPYPFAIPHVALTVDLDPAATVVHARLEIERKTPGDHAALVLQGEDLELLALQVDGQTWSRKQYQLTDSTLVLPNLPDSAVVEITSRCCPQTNTKLMGLYVSNGNFFTQCEAEGFRRICWFADRPDVLSRYQVTLRADAARYPVLLSNGNLLASSNLLDGRHQAVWQDPHPKPCYLFALVAGQFACRETRTHTRCGREVLLQVYSDPGTESQTEWAMQSLLRALRWDETRFGLELDLDRFMIVATRDFNMGAMENKGLNIFNAAYVLADPRSATDANYRAIEAVIGHEYFHNWTGNRVTCRDWFQLSLKEGLTVFRDHAFSADMLAAGLDETAAASARAVKRIDDVALLRAAQFPEDAGPMAHPIRPESYQEIGNFYTATVYEKGAEVIRMQHTLLGEDGFQAGMREYFRRHDGQAVTCDDFVDAMESVYLTQHPEQDPSASAGLSIFRRWYSQAGTPTVSVALTHNAAAKTCAITLTQRCDPVGVEKRAGSDFVKQPFHIPFALGLLDTSGRALRLRLAGTTQHHDTALLELRETSATWVFEDIATPPVPSLLRDFSAPVIVEYDWRDEELALLSAHDPNPYARWEAGQALASRHVLGRVVQAEGQAAAPVAAAPVIDHNTDHSAPHNVPDIAVLVAVWRALLQAPALDAAYRARALALPADKILAVRMRPIDPPALALAYDTVRAQLGYHLSDLWLATYHDNHHPGPYTPAPGPAGQRALKNLALGYLAAGGSDDARTLARAQYQTANNMTDQFAALSVLVNDVFIHDNDQDEAAQLLADFYQQWQHDAQVIDKWFALQATMRTTTVARMRSLAAHPAFTLANPNRARALIFQFCMHNARHLHAADGSGYAWWVEQVLALDALNPEVAARLARTLDNWANFAPHLREPMRAALQHIRTQPGLSRNVLEIVGKALDF